MPLIEHGSHRWTNEGEVGLVGLLGRLVDRLDTSPVLQFAQAHPGGPPTPPHPHVVRGQCPCAGPTLGFAVPESVLFRVLRLTIRDRLVVQGVEIDSDYVPCY